VQAIQGLTETEVLARRARGEGNEVDFGTSRSYLDIARANVFNLFNGILVTIVALLVALGRVNDALISIGPLFLANALIRTGQEIYAKHILDQITLEKGLAFTVSQSGTVLVSRAFETLWDPAPPA